MEEYGAPGTIDADERNVVWAIRGIDVDVRYRIKVLAARRSVTQGELINPLLLAWLNAGAPAINELFEQEGSLA